MSSRSRLSLAAIAVVAFAAATRAQPSPLEQVPAKSPIVIQVRGYEQSFARLNAALKAAAPDFAPRIAGQIENGVAGLLMGRELKGLPKDGPLFVVFTEVPTAEAEFPEFAVVAKVSSYTKFRDGLLKDDEKKELKAKPGYESTKIEDAEVFFLDLDGYAVVTPSEKAMKLFLDKKTETLAAKLDKTLSTKLLDADVSVYVDVKAVTKQFGDQIEMFKTLLGQAADQGQGAGLDKDQIEMVKKVFEGMFRLVDDTEKLVAAVEFRPDGFMLRLHSQVGDKTKTNEILKASKPTAFEAIDNLPAGRMAYVAASPDMEFMRSLLLASAGGRPANADDDNKPLADAIKTLSDLKLKNWSSANDNPNISFQVFQYENNRAAVEATMKMYRALPENAAFGGAVIKGKPVIKPDAEKVNGVSFNSVKLTWDIEKSLEKYPEQLREQLKAMLKRTLGESANDWFGADGKTMIQVRAKDWPSARALIESYLTGKTILKDDSVFHAARKQLPAKANVMLILDANRTAIASAESIGEMARMLPGATPAKKPKAPEGKATYIGFALGMQPRNGTIDLWIPADAIKAIIKVFGPMFGGVDG